MDQSSEKNKSENQDLKTSLEKYSPKGSYPVKRGGHRFTKEQTEFLLQAIVHIGRPSEIVRQFQEKFGISVSKDWVKKLKHLEKYRPRLQQIRSEFEKGIQTEWLVSKRNRVRALTELFEKACEKGDLESARKNLVEIRTEIEGKVGDAYFMAIQQNNEYINMTVPELKNEIRLLSKKLGPELLKITESTHNNAEDELK